MSQQFAVIEPQSDDLSPADAFAAWLLYGRAGDICAYHHGLLAVDRDPAVSKLDIPAREALTAVADLAMAFAEAGRVLLVQQRLGDGEFRYLAILASKRKPDTTRLANSEIKRWSAVGTAAREQLVLSGMLARLITDLPASISLPAADGGEDEDPTYRPLFGPKCATAGELRKAVATLWKSIADDQRKAKALTQLLDLLMSCGAGDEVRVSEALLTKACGPNVAQVTQ